MAKAVRTYNYGLATIPLLAPARKGRRCFYSLESGRRSSFFCPNWRAQKPSPIKSAGACRWISFQFLSWKIVNYILCETSKSLLKVPLLGPTKKPRASAVKKNSLYLYIYLYINWKKKYSIFLYMYIRPSCWGRVTSNLWNFLYIFFNFSHLVMESLSSHNLKTLICHNK